MKGKILKSVGGELLLTVSFRDSGNFGLYPAYRRKGPSVSAGISLRRIAEHKKQDPALPLTFTDILSGGNPEYRPDKTEV